MLKFKHSGRIGDVVYALPLVKKMAEESHAKAMLYLINDRPDILPLGRFHPSGQIMMSESHCQFIAPLIAQQEYIDQVIILSTRDFNKLNKNNKIINLDCFREEFHQVNLSSSYLPIWYRKLFTYAIDIEHPWLSLNKLIAGNKNNIKNKNYKIIINRSTRYNNNAIDYRFLDGFSPKNINHKIGFIGVPLEYDFFVQQYKLKNIDYIATENAIDVAKLLLSCELFLGNQSAVFAIAEGLKINRALEVFEPAPNVIPIGNNCLEYIYTENLLTFISREFQLNFKLNFNLIKNKKPIFILDNLQSKKSNINIINIIILLKLILREILPPICMRALRKFRNFIIQYK